jgi:hypothetical protein
MADDSYSYKGQTIVLKLHDDDVSGFSITSRSSKICKRVETKGMEGGVMGKKVSVVLLILSSMFLVAWFPAMTPDQRIEMQAHLGWSCVEIDQGNDGTLDEIIDYYYNDHGQLVGERSDTPNDSYNKDYYYYTYGKLEHEEWDYHDDGTIDEIDYYDYDSSGMMFRLRIDFDADNVDDEAIYYSYNAGRLVQEDSDYNLDRTIDDVTEYIYDQSGKVIQANHYPHNPELDNQTTYYYYDAFGNIKRQEEDYKNDGLIDYISLYYYDTAGRPYREIDDDVNDSLETEYQDATLTYFYDNGSGGHNDDYDAYYNDDDDDCFISASPSDHNFPHGILFLVLSGIVLISMSRITRKLVSK